MNKKRKNELKSQKTKPGEYELIKEGMLGVIDALKSGKKLKSSTVKFDLNFN